MRGKAGLKDKDQMKYMRAAIRQAEFAARLDEVPVGAVIVKNRKIISRGYNLRENRQDATMHAEIAAIRQACRRLKTWRLNGCSLFVTLEPCVMCAGAIIQARIDHVYFGTEDPKAGACGSVFQAFDLPLNHTVSWKGGLLRTECRQQLKDYFSYRREQDKIAGSRSVRRKNAEKALQDNTSSN